MSTKKTKAPKARRKEKAESVMPKVIYANASPRSVGGVSMFDAGDRINAKTVANFFSDEEVVTRSVNRLRDAGFEILQVSLLTINIAGSKETYERAFNTSLIAEERDVIKGGAVRDTATFIDLTPRRQRCPASFRQRGAQWLIWSRVWPSRSRDIRWHRQCSPPSKPIGI